MTKKQITAELSAVFGMSKKKTAELVTTVLDTCFSTAAQDGRCVWGKHQFKLRKRAARTGRNPRTGELVMIPPKTEVVYKRTV